MPIRQEITVDLKKYHNHKSHYFVLPKELFAQLGIENLSEGLEKDDLVAETKYFDSIQEAERNMFA